MAGAAGSARVRAFVGLGANVGDAAASLAAAVHALGALPGATIAGVSRLYVTRPVGVTTQPDFHNAVVALDVPSGSDAETGAVALLVALKGIERAFGRRARGRWGPRELDLDLLLFGDAQLSVQRPPAGVSLDPGHRERLLVVPHPEAADRLFVLAPLAELAPDLVPPGWTPSVRAARDRRLAEEGPDAVRAVAAWNGEGWAGMDTEPGVATEPGRSVQRFAADYVAAFNDSVVRGDVAGLLARFADDAVMRFENVPGAGVLEFVGRAACTSACERQLPDDQIEITGPVSDQGGTVVIPFAWRRDGAAGVLRVTVRGGRVSRMVVAFA